MTSQGTETTLHSFNPGGGDGMLSVGVTRDGKGNLYGTTGEGGAYGYGTVFKVPP